MKKYYFAVFYLFIFCSFAMAVNKKVVIEGATVHLNSYPNRWIIDYLVDPAVFDNLPEYSPAKDEIPLPLKKLFEVVWRAVPKPHTKKNTRITSVCLGRFCYKNELSDRYWFYKVQLESARDKKTFDYLILFDGTVAERRQKKR